MGETERSLREFLQIYTFQKLFAVRCKSVIEIDAIYKFTIEHPSMKSSQLNKFTFEMFTSDRRSDSLAVCQEFARETLVPFTRYYFFSSSALIRINLRIAVRDTRSKTRGRGRGEKRSEKTRNRENKRASTRTETNR